MRIAVIGHVEHVTIARVPALPVPGDILHLDAPQVIAGGGGGIAFFQFAASEAELHLFTALGNDDGARYVRDRIAATSATIHAAPRAEPHTRDIVLVTSDGERTIIVVGRPLHPRHDDPLPWDILATCDAAYFTGEDPATLRLARQARFLVATARRKHVLDAAGVNPDVVVGSIRDPREGYRRSDYAHAPGAVVMTDGPRAGTIETSAGISRFDPPTVTAPVVGAYGAGDTFAAALTYHLALGFSLDDACLRASSHAAAVLTSINPLPAQQPLLPH